MNNRRDDRRFRAAAAEYRTQCETAGAPCHLCGQPIQYSAPDTHPDAYNLDHFHPVSTHPELTHDPANWRPSHASCNKSRGNKPAEYPLGTTTRAW